jgi:serine/threonine protein kinase
MLSKMLTKMLTKTSTTMQALAIFEPLCLSIQAMHAQSPPIAHRDIKPENLLCVGNTHVIFYFSEFHCVRLSSAYLLFWPCRSRLILRAGKEGGHPASMQCFVCTCTPS